MAIQFKETGTPKCLAEVNAVCKAMGISDVAVTPKTETLLKINKAINVLFGQFVSVYTSEFAMTDEQEDEQFVTPYLALKGAFDNAISNMVIGSNIDIKKIEI